MREIAKLCKIEPLKKEIAMPAAIREKSVKFASRSQLLMGKEPLEDMESYRKKVLATPESARDFLIRLGAMPPGGKVPQGILRNPG